MNNYGLIIRIVQKMNIKDYHLREDCVQYGVIGLLKAEKKYIPGKGKFSTFAGKCIFNEIVSFLRKEKKEEYVKNLTLQ